MNSAAVLATFRERSLVTTRVLLPHKHDLCGTRGHASARHDTGGRRDWWRSHSPRHPTAATYRTQPSVDHCE
ncbi:MAG: hypothetical protein JWO08_3242, partial [Verrucomicrobiaceae bacterium]|nr:hypothetical protein [Verrucomicrobiaceae bacterium]